MEGETATSSSRTEDLSLNEEEEDCLLTNRGLLSKNVRLVPELWTYLRQNRLTGFMENKIKLSRTEYEQVGGLLDFLAKRTLRDFHDFRDALVATCQRHVVERCLTVSSSSSDADQKSLWKEHRVVLEDMIRPTDDLLHATTARQIIDHSQKDAILGTTGAKEKIHKMLEFLAINGVTDLTLHEALKEADQHDVVDFLEGMCALMTPEQNNSLERRGLAEVIGLDSRMIQYLIERRILNKSEKDIIQKQASEHEGVRCLLDIIGHCSRSTYDVFVRALSSTGQHEAVSILKPGHVTTTGVLGPFESHQQELGKYLSEIVKPTMNELKSQKFTELRIVVGTADPTKFERRDLREYSFTKEKTESIGLSQLFLKHKQDKAPRSVLVLGPPGAGKTNLCFHLAEQAISKRMHEPNTIPFIIPLRELENEPITMKDFLLTRCSPTCPKYQDEEIWEAIVKNEAKLWFIIDGYDENDIMKNPTTVTSTTALAKPEVLLNSLIKKRLFKLSCIMITSRPYNLEKVWSVVDRRVELHGLTEEGLWDLLYEQSDEVKQNAKAFLERNKDILSLCCSSPLFAVSFIKYIAFKKTAIFNMTKWELCIRLVESQLLAKKEMTCVPEVLKENGILLQNLASLCLDSFTNCTTQTRILFTQEDLDEYNISVNCLPTGLISVYNRITRSMHGEEVKKHYHLLHLNFQETLAAVKLALDDTKDISKLARDNRGKLDVIFVCLMALLGNVQCRPFLWGISSRDKADSTYEVKCRNVMTTLMGSPRRVLAGGDWFLLDALNESKQKCLTGEVMRVLGRRWLTSDHSDQLMIANQLIGLDPGHNTNDPLVRVEVCGIHNMKYCPRATALIHDSDGLMAANIAENAEHLHNISSLSLSIESLTPETLAGIAGELSKLPNLEAVLMDYYRGGSSSSANESSVLGCLPTIPSLKYLSLSDCGLTSDDVVTVTSSCPRLRHLDISRNHSVWGVVLSNLKLTGLSLARCRMKADELVEMAASSGGTLLFLNAIDDTVCDIPKLSSTHIHDLFTCCPHLVELYVVEGGELVRALSEGREACHLKHLWLRRCDLSSSSSSVRQVSPSMLSDVLVRHQSISSLTLRGCRHFTSDFMCLLSSSMASITSLFISPHYLHPPRSSDLVSLIHASPCLTQLWLGGVTIEWRASDYIEVICAVNASPALRVVGLDVERLSVDEVRGVVRALTRRLTQLCLMVDDEKLEEYTEVVLEGEPGVIKLDGDDLYCSYALESGSCYQHLPPSLHDHFRPIII